MIAEFYGLPGSGKSTLVNMIKDRFPEKAELIVFSKKLFTKKNIKNIFSLEYAAFSFKLTRLWIVKLFTMKKELFSKKSFHDEIKTVFYFASLYLEFMYLREHDSSKKLFIVDHGLLQCLSSLVWDKKNINVKSDSLIAYIAEHFSDSVEYVYVAGCGIQETFNRINGRPWPIRLHSYGNDEAAEILNNLENLFDKAQNIISQRGKLFYSDNSLDTQAEFENLCEHFNLQVSQ